MGQAGKTQTGWVVWKVSRKLAAFREWWSECPDLVPTAQERHKKPGEGPKECHDLASEQWQEEIFSLEKTQGESHDIIPVTIPG